MNASISYPFAISAVIVLVKGSAEYGIKFMITEYIKITSFIKKLANIRYVKCENRYPDDWEQRIYSRDTVIFTSPPDIQPWSSISYSMYIDINSVFDMGVDYVVFNTLGCVN